MPFIETKDHTRLFYKDWGGDKPVVFISSLYLSSDMWEYQLPYLASQGLRCIAYDRRGHRRSDSPWDEYDYTTLADDLAELIEHLNLREVTLVGHSMGGGEVVRYLSRHGTDRVAKIALLSTSAPFPMKTEDNPIGIEKSVFNEGLNSIIKDRPKWLADNALPFFGVGLHGVSISPEFTQWMIQLCLQCSPKAVIECNHTIFTTDLREEMRQITVPALIIHGDHDQSAPSAEEGARNFYQTISSSCTKVQHTVCSLRMRIALMRICLRSLSNRKERR
ncbi:alpha/beta fold hydrolase [Heyndrickxia acidicola]|uniref:Alpha/beta hydrolase n=1 Tax=Heyndrickxia acidicola TaxID=209389 RepID=A0ABU6MGQ8_9BACI|nr:alpha/beta hydrolase [Heyndrickxia acidicola]MED1203598.1 alpha/beta hydrolase [Heyndrickxia acidicola]